EPVPPRYLLACVPRDLETICLKCLHKDPGRRYGSARELAEDLQRWSRHEPIRARQSSPWERARKWVRRRPAVAALAALVVMVATVGVGLVLWQWRRAEQANRDLGQAAADLEQTAQAEAAARRLAQEQQRTAEAARNKAQRNLDLARAHLYFSLV